MEKEFSLRNIKLSEPHSKVKEQFKSCANQIEKKVPEVERIHCSISLPEQSPKKYQIDLHAVANFIDIISSIETDDVKRGLRAITKVTIEKLKGGKKARNKTERREKGQLEFATNKDLKKAL